MVTKYQNSLNPARACNLHRGVGLATALLILGLSSTAVTASEPELTDPCDNALISEAEAQRISKALLREQGWIESRTIRSTLGIGTRFHIKEAKCMNGQWHVSAVLKEGLSNNSNAVVLVNSHSGAIETTVRSTLLAAE